jgi:hypothetical protein
MLHCLLTIVRTALATRKSPLVIILIRWGKPFNYISFQRTTSSAASVFYFILVYTMSASSWVLPILSFSDAILLAFSLGSIKIDRISDKKGDREAESSLSKTGFSGNTCLYIA